MPRPSSIKRLPPEVQETIGRLRDQGRTLDEILGHLRQLEVDVSRSALGRHVKQLDAIGEELRRSRTIAEAMVARFGDAPESRTARLNIELAHTLLLKLMVSEDGEPVKLDAKEAMFVSSAISSLTTAAKKDADGILQARREEAKKAAAAAESAAKDAGLSDTVVDEIKRRILGLQAA
jgi:hypothetical protein